MHPVAQTILVVAVVVVALFVINDHVTCYNLFGLKTTCVTH